MGPANQKPYSFTVRLLCMLYMIWVIWPTTLDTLWYKWYVLLIIMDTLDVWGPFNKRGPTLTPAWIRKHIPSEVWNEITYSFPNFNGTIVEVWEWTSGFTPLIAIHVITYTY